ncbi:hypothetical protein [Natronincola ferrireducens]|uniref:hypothetical protein n=1 Tax=Natronincola ferrireducens TaxID=393762 RepID=UPI000B8A4779|nr:hypothetical protein [Natronincola ferrireducens]
MLQVFESLGGEKHSLLLKHISQYKVMESTAKVHAINNAEIIRQDAYNKSIYSVRQCSFIKHVSTGVNKLLRTSM